MDVGRVSKNRLFPDFKLRQVLIFTSFDVLQSFYQRSGMFRCDAKQLATQHCPNHIFVFLQDHFQEPIQVT